mgnify:CR=1 FL=1|jgi:hypothetical protein
MGQANEPQAPSFDIKKYMERRPELHEREVVEIKNIFDSMIPIDGYVDINDIHNHFANTGELNLIKEKFGTKTRVDFDEFFNVISVVLLERRSKFKNVDYENNSRNVSCFYCPYPTERTKFKALSPH